MLKAWSDWSKNAFTKTKKRTLEKITTPGSKAKLGIGTLMPADQTYLFPSQVQGVPTSFR